MSKWPGRSFLRAITAPKSSPTPQRNIEPTPQRNSSSEELYFGRANPNIQNSIGMSSWAGSLIAKSIRREIASPIRRRTFSPRFEHTQLLVGSESCSGRDERQSICFRMPSMKDPKRRLHVRHFWRRRWGNPHRLYRNQLAKELSKRGRIARGEML